MDEKDSEKGSIVLSSAFSKANFDAYSVLPRLTLEKVQKFFSRYAPNQNDSAEVQLNTDDQKIGNTEPEVREVLDKRHNKRPNLTPLVKRHSALTAEQQKKYLELFRTYGSKTIDQPSIRQKKEMKLYAALNRTVAKEHNDLNDYLEKTAEARKATYFFLHAEARRFLKDKLSHRAYLGHAYPRHYAVERSITLPQSSASRKLELQFQGNILQLGRVPRLVYPDLVRKSCFLPLNYPQLKKYFSLTDKPSGDEHPSKKPISQDSIAQQLAEKHCVRVVLSMSGLRALVESAHPDKSHEWYLPIKIAGDTDHKVVFIDKPLLEHLSVKQMNTIYHKYAMKVQLTHFNPSKWRKRKSMTPTKNSDANRNGAERLIPELEDDIFSGGDADISELESFGIGSKDLEDPCTSGVRLGFERNIENQDKEMLPAEAEKQAADVTKTEDNGTCVKSSPQKEETNQEVMNVDAKDEEKCTKSPQKAEISQEVMNTNDKDDEICKKDGPQSSEINQEVTSINVKDDEICTKESSEKAEINPEVPNSDTKDEKICTKASPQKAETNLEDPASLPSANDENLELSDVNKKEDLPGDAIDEQDVVMDDDELPKTKPKTPVKESSSLPTIERDVVAASGVKRRLNFCFDDDDTGNDSGSDRLFVDTEAESHGTATETEADPPKKDEECLLTLQKELGCSALDVEASNNPVAETKDTEAVPSSGVSAEDSQPPNKDSVEPAVTSDIQEAKPDAVNKTDVQLDLPPDSGAQLEETKEMLDTKQVASSGSKSDDSHHSGSAKLRTPNSSQSKIRQETPAAYPQPDENDNVTYSLWSVGELSLLVRSKIDCCQSISNNPWVLYPKLEYQAEFGAEVNSPIEIAVQWLKIMIHPSSQLYRARINALTSEVLMCEEVTAKHLSEALGSSQTQLILERIYHIFEELLSLTPGQYMLCHSKDGDVLTLYHATEARGSLDLHTETNLQLTAIGDIESAFGVNSSVQHDIAERDVPWLPIDTSVNLLSLVKKNRVPGTFLPKFNPQENFPKRLKSKKKKKKAKSK